jgi:hypothetical protein
MKRTLLIGATLLAAFGAYGQGYVNYVGHINFANNAAPVESLITTNGHGPPGGMSGPPGTFRFELFWTYDGWVNPDWCATGITNANSGVLGPGRIANRNSVVLNGVEAGTWIQVQVRGWSANLGNATTWAEAEAAIHRWGWDDGTAWYGVSGTGRVQLAPSTTLGATIFAGGAPPPAGTVQISGFELQRVVLIPEPSTLALVGFGLVGFVFARRHKLKNEFQPSLPPMWRAGASRSADSLVLGKESRNPTDRL